MNQNFATLKSLLVMRAVSRGKVITLASGKVSDTYVDCKKLSLHGPSLDTLSEALFAKLRALDSGPFAVAGVSVGGDPLVAGVIIAGARQNVELQGLLVRKEAKKHGMSQGRSVEGPAATDVGPLWLLEDVVSTGGSSLTALQNLQQEGYKVTGILCIVDREMGGLEKLRDAFPIRAEALFRLSELG